MLAVAAATAMLAGCSRASEEGGGLTPEQIEALGLANKADTPEAQVVAGPPDLLGLQPLSDVDMAQARMVRGCLLVHAGQPMLAAIPYYGLVRRNGELVSLRADGPVGGSGGFFQTETLSISIGQIQAPPGEAALPGGSARARINDRRRGESTEVRAVWRCAGATGSTQ